MATARSYHSPLRQAQADRTRAHILRTMVDLLARGDSTDFSIKQLADEAEVSERTIYRYFPDRNALLDGLGHHLTEIMGGAPEASLTSIDQFTDVVVKVWAIFDDMPAVIRASFLLNPDPANRTDDQLLRSRRFIEIAARAFPDLTDDEQRKLGILMRTMASTYNWLVLREEFDMDGTEAGELVSWALSCVVDRVQKTGRVGR